MYHIVNRETFFLDAEKVRNTATIEIIKNLGIPTSENETQIYAEIYSIIEEFKKFCIYIDLEALALLPDARFETLMSLGRELFYILEGSYNSAYGDLPIDSLMQQRRHILDASFTSNKWIIWEIICESISLLNYSKTDNALDAKIKLLNNGLDKVNGTEIKYNKLFTQITEELANAGVGKHSVLFSKQVKYHLKLANDWRKAIIGLLSLNAIIILMMFVLVLKFYECPNFPRIQISILGIALISLVSYGIALCVKSYFAEKHNQSINAHRANALGTFNTFANSTTDKDEKSAILLQATNTIFSFQKSGFLRKDSETSNPNLVVEILQKILDKKN